MTSMLVYNLLIILAAGLVAGIVSKRLGIPMVIGYLLVGAAIGEGGLKLFSHQDPADIDAVSAVSTEAVRVTEIEEGPDPVVSVAYQKEILNQLADFGALFLLFSIGIHFAPSDLVKNKKFLFVGGPVQMILVIIPLALVGHFFLEDWRIGLLIGLAVALSSTVLVFKSLEEFGQASSPYGKRAVSILLFQDIATAPILLVIPLLFPAAGESDSILHTLGAMGTKALFFVVLIVGIRLLFTKRGIDIFAQLKSVEIMVLFTILLLAGVCTVADKLQLPEAIGAFAAGVALSENRLSAQISALVIPFRETFSAIFFVTLGALLDPSVLMQYPGSTLMLLAGLLLLKVIAGGIAFKVVGLSAIPALAMGLGISQLGELSFIILQEGPFRENSPELYQQVLFVALASMILTPLFLKVAMEVVKKRPIVENTVKNRVEPLLPQESEKRRAIVVGLGPIGRSVTHFLAEAGVDVCLIDMNPNNLHAYAQEGFRTITGDATEPKILQYADILKTNLVVITIPNDSFATGTIMEVRKLRPSCSIVARCRYSAYVQKLKKAGADLVFCEETEASEKLVKMMTPFI